MENPAKAFRERVKQLLKERDLTGRDLAKVAKRSEAWASMFLNGHRGVPVKVAGRIAEYFQLDFREFFGSQAPPADRFILDVHEQALIQAFRKLPAEGRAQLIDEYDESENEQIRSLDPKLAYRLIARVGRAKTKARRKAFRGKKKTPSKTRARLRLMLWTGWPQKQIMRLRAEDINWTDETVYIRRRKKGKGAQGRRLPLFPGAVVALKAFVAAKAFGEFSASSMCSSFVDAVAKENAWRARCVPPKPPIKAYPYMLRHTFGTELARRLTDERAIQEYMLHATPQQTRRYTEAATSDRLLAARAAIRGPEKLVKVGSGRKRKKRA